MKDPGTGFIGRLSKREIMLIALLIACIGAYACFSLLLSPLMEENGDLAKYVDSLTLRESSLSAEYAKAGEYGARIEEAVRDNAEIRGQIPAYLASHEFVRDVEAAAEDNNVTVTGIS
ncbi:MAG: hypothetical protein FWE70_06155, partial [Oscillospiraceae bacterium]|nr:hypothetical protein [Oscillospiraceae bacterium]